MQFFENCKKNLTQRAVCGAACAPPTDRKQEGTGETTPRDGNRPKRPREKPIDGRPANTGRTGRPANFLNGRGKSPLRGAPIPRAPTTATGLPPTGHNTASPAPTGGGAQAEGEGNTQTLGKQETRSRGGRRAQRARHPRGGRGRGRRYYFPPRGGDAGARCPRGHEYPQPRQRDKRRHCGGCPATQPDGDRRAGPRPPRVACEQYMTHTDLDHTPQRHQPTEASCSADRRGAVPATGRGGRARAPDRPTRMPEGEEGVRGRHRTRAVRTRAGRAGRGGAGEESSAPAPPPPRQVTPTGDLCR